MSTAYTTQRIFNAIPDTSLTIGGADYSRRMEIGGDWVRLRFGMLCSISSTATVSNAMLLFGLSSSNGPSVSAYDTLNFLGASLLGGPTALAATYTAAADYPYFSNTTTRIVRKRLRDYPVNVTGSLTAHFAPTFLGYRKRRTPVIVDITRPVGGSGLATVTVYGCSSTTVQTDYAPDRLWQALDATGTPTLYGTALSVLATSAAILTGEELGTLDTISVFWTSSRYPLEIYALGATVIQKKYSAWLPEPTVVGAFDSFEAYAVSNSVGTLPAAPAITVSPNGTVSTIGAAGWSADGTLIGYYNDSFAAGWYGTMAGLPLDTFESYVAGTTGTISVLANGSYYGTVGGWSGDGTLIGTPSFMPSFSEGYYGTMAGTPMDSFESYGTGTFYTDLVAPAYGLGWDGAGTFLVT